MENPEQELPIRKDSNKIYFLVAVILALLGTNAYLFFKDQKANDRIVTISDEKTRMQTEIDKIEAELDNASSNNLTLSDQMLKNQAIAREKIDELRSSLKQGQLTQVQLANAQEEIKQLKYFVSKYVLLILMSFILKILPIFVRKSSFVRHNSNLVGLLN